MNEEKNKIKIKLFFSHRNIKKVQKLFENFYVLTKILNFQKEKGKNFKFFNCPELLKTIRKSEI